MADPIENGHNVPSADVEMKEEAVVESTLDSIQPVDATDPQPAPGLSLANNGDIMNDLSTAAAAAATPPPLAPEPLSAAHQAPPAASTPPTSASMAARPGSMPPQPSARPEKPVAHGGPTRQYLNQHVTPHLLEGVKYLAAHEPEKPLQWLANFLQERSKEVEG